QQELSREVAAAEAPGALAAQARKLGLVPSGDAGFLVVGPSGSTRAVGTATAATVPTPPPAPTPSATPSRPAQVSGHPTQAPPSQRPPPPAHGRLRGRLHPAGDRRRPARTASGARRLPLRGRGAAGAPRHHEHPGRTRPHPRPGRPRARVHRRRPDDLRRPVV